MTKMISRNEYEHACCMSPSLAFKLHEGKNLSSVFTAHSLERKTAPGTYNVLSKYLPNE